MNGFPRMEHGIGQHLRVALDSSVERRNVDFCMKYPDEYVQYLIHFHSDRDFFECHEILEEYWKKQQPDRNPIWVALIQLAVGLYHHRRGNMAGANKMLQSCLLRMDEAGMANLGIDYHKLRSLIQERIASIVKGEAYRNFNLPITDESLEQQCIQICKERGIPWQSEAGAEKKSLIHRHMLRDRSEVMEARESQLLKRKLEFVKDVRNVYSVAGNGSIYGQGKALPVVYSQPTHALHPSHGILTLPGRSGQIHLEFGLVLKIAADYHPSRPINQLIGGFALGMRFTLDDLLSSLKKKGCPWLLATGFKHSAVLSEFHPFSNMEDLLNLEYFLFQDGNLAQIGNPRAMLYSISEMISYIGTNMGLGRGDIIYTGTSAGKHTIKDGDILKMELKHQSTNMHRIYGPLRVRFDQKNK